MTGKTIAKIRGGILLLCAGILLLGGCGRKEPEAIRVGALKGPTSMGLLVLTDRADRGETEDDYDFRMAVGAEELLGLMAKGELDIALVPANAAAAFYQKTQGGIRVININTLGVLYCVTGTEGIRSAADLKGRTIYLTGKGATPEACLKYILKGNGLSEKDYNLEYKSEAAEVAALLANDPAAVGVLPQPFVTGALMQNESLRAALDLNQEWEKLQGQEGGGMVTGVTIVRSEFLEEHREAVERFLKEHKESAAAVNKDPESAGVLAVSAGIVTKEEIAQQAIPGCNITCITGEEMKERLRGYLEALAEFDADLTGGGVPDEGFYFTGF